MKVNFQLAPCLSKEVNQEFIQPGSLKKEAVNRRDLQLY